MDKVDEAVATALTGLSDHLTGVKEIDDFMEQSLITLGAMVKIEAIAKKLDMSDEQKMMFSLLLVSYRKLIDSVAYNLTEEE